MLLLIGKGLQNKEIATRLGIATKTVELLKTRLYKKLGVAGAVDAVRFAMRERLLRTTEQPWAAR